MRTERWRRERKEQTGDLSNVSIENIHKLRYYNKKLCEHGILDVYVYDWFHAGLSVCFIHAYLRAHIHSHVCIPLSNTYDFRVMLPSFLWDSLCAHHHHQLDDDYYYWVLTAARTHKMHSSSGSRCCAHVSSVKLSLYYDCNIALWLSCFNVVVLCSCYFLHFIKVFWKEKW